MNAFITGSHAYGKPNEKSDVDLVIQCDEETRNMWEWRAQTRSSVSFYLYDTWRLASQTFHSHASQ
jgi:predicted nucleotidyltransferase